ncbi:MAG: hypothetical protein ACYCX4_06910 [Bacillota bacterium]
MQGLPIAIRSVDDIKVVAVDFDSTITDGDINHIGSVRPYCREVLVAMREQGIKVIIWTCRAGDYLEEAKKFLKDNDIFYDKINENIDDLGFTTSPKIYADLYIDDRGWFPGWKKIGRLFGLLKSRGDEHPVFLYARPSDKPDGILKTVDLSKSKTNIKHPGARGGKYYRTDKGDIRYGSKPEPRKSNAEGKPEGNKATDDKTTSKSKTQKGGVIEFKRPDMEKPIKGRVTAVGRDGVTVRDAGGNKFMVRHEHVTSHKPPVNTKEKQGLAEAIHQQGHKVDPVERFADKDGTVRVTQEQVNILRQIVAHGANINVGKIAKDATQEEAQAIIDRYSSPLETNDVNPGGKGGQRSILKDKAKNFNKSNSIKTFLNTQKLVKAVQGEKPQNELDAEAAYVYAKQVGYTDPQRIKQIVEENGPLILVRIPLGKINVWDSYRAALEYVQNKGHIDWENFKLSSADPDTPEEQEKAIQDIRKELFTPLDQKRQHYYLTQGGKPSKKITRLEFHIFKFKRLLKRFDKPVKTPNPAIADQLYDNGKLGLADGNHRVTVFAAQGRRSMEVYVPKRFLEQMKLDPDEVDLPEAWVGKLGKSGVLV